MDKNDDTCSVVSGTTNGTTSPLLFSLPEKTCQQEQPLFPALHNIYGLSPVIALQSLRHDSRKNREDVNHYVIESEDPTSVVNQDQSYTAPALSVQDDTSNVQECYLVDAVRVTVLESTPAENGAAFDKLNKKYDTLSENLDHVNGNTQTVQEMCGDDEEDAEQEENVDQVFNEQTENNAEDLRQKLGDSKATISPKCKHEKVTENTSRDMPQNQVDNQAIIPPKCLQEVIINALQEKVNERDSEDIRQKQWDHTNIAQMECLHLQEEKNDIASTPEWLTTLTKKNDSNLDESQQEKEAGEHGSVVDTDVSVKRKSTDHILDHLFSDSPSVQTDEVIPTSSCAASVSYGYKCDKEAIRSSTGSTYAPSGNNGVNSDKEAISVTTMADKDKNNQNKTSKNSSSQFQKDNVSSFDKELHFLTEEKTSNVLVENAKKASSLVEQNQMERTLIETERNRLHVASENQCFDTDLQVLPDKEISNSSNENDEKASQAEQSQLERTLIDQPLDTERNCAEDASENPCPIIKSAIQNKELDYESQDLFQSSPQITQQHSVVNTDCRNEKSDDKSYNIADCDNQSIGSCSSSLVLHCSIKQHGEIPESQYKPSGNSFVPENQERQNSNSFVLGSQERQNSNSFVADNQNNAKNNSFSLESQGRLKSTSALARNQDKRSSNADVGKSQYLKSEKRQDPSLSQPSQHMTCSPPLPKSSGRRKIKNNRNTDFIYNSQSSLKISSPEDYNCSSQDRCSITAPSQKALLPPSRQDKEIPSQESCSTKTSGKAMFSSSPHQKDILSQDYSTTTPSEKALISLLSQEKDFLTQKTRSTRLRSRNRKSSVSESHHDQEGLTQEKCPTTRKASVSYSPHGKQMSSQEKCSTRLRSGSKKSSICESHHDQESSSQERCSSMTKRKEALNSPLLYASESPSRDRYSKRIRSRQNSISPSSQDSDLLSQDKVSTRMRSRRSSISESMTDQNGPSSQERCTTAPKRKGGPNSLSPRGKDLSTQERCTATPKRNKGPNSHLSCEKESLSQKIFPKRSRNERLLLSPSTLLSQPETVRLADSQEKGVKSFLSQPECAKFSSYPPDHQNVKHSKKPSLFQRFSSLKGKKHHLSVTSNKGINKALSTQNNDVISTDKKNVKIYQNTVVLLTKLDNIVSLSSKVVYKAKRAPAKTNIASGERGTNFSKGMTKMGYEAKHASPNTNASNCDQDMNRVLVVDAGKQSGRENACGSLIPKLAGKKPSRLTETAQESEAQQNGQPQLPPEMKSPQAKTKDMTVLTVEQARHKPKAAPDNPTLSGATMEGCQLSQSSKVSDHVPQTQSVNPSQVSKSSDQDLALLAHEKEVETFKMLMRLYDKLSLKIDAGHCTEAETKLSSFTNILARLKAGQAKEENKLKKSAAADKGGQSSSRTQARIDLLRERQQMMEAATLRHNKLLAKCSSTKSPAGRSSQVNNTKQASSTKTVKVSTSNNNPKTTSETLKSTAPPANLKKSESTNLSDGSNASSPTNPNAVGNRQNSTPYVFDDTNNLGQTKTFSSIKSDVCEKSKLRTMTANCNQRSDYDDADAKKQTSRGQPTTPLCNLNTHAQTATVPKKKPRAGFLPPPKVSKPHAPSLSTDESSLNPVKVNDKMVTQPCTAYIKNKTTSSENIGRTYSLYSITQPYAKPNKNKTISNENNNDIGQTTEHEETTSFCDVNQANVIANENKTTSNRNDDKLSASEETFFFCDVHRAKMDRLSRIEETIEAVIQQSRVDLPTITCKNDNLSQTQAPRSPCFTEASGYSFELGARDDDKESMCKKMSAHDLDQGLSLPCLTQGNVTSTSATQPPGSPCFSEASSFMFVLNSKVLSSLGKETTRKDKKNTLNKDEVLDGRHLDNMSLSSVKTDVQVSSAKARNSVDQETSRKSTPKEVETMDLSHLPLDNASISSAKVRNSPNNNLHRKDTLIKDHNLHQSDLPLDNASASSANPNTFQAAQPPGSPSSTVASSYMFAVPSCNTELMAPQSRRPTRTKVASHQEQQRLDLSRLPLCSDDPPMTNAISGTLTLTTNKKIVPPSDPASPTSTASSSLFPVRSKEIARRIALKFAAASQETQPPAVETQQPCPALSQGINDNLTSTLKPQETLNSGKIVTRNTHAKTSTLLADRNYTSSSGTRTVFHIPTPVSKSSNKPRALTSASKPSEESAPTQNNTNDASFSQHIKNISQHVKTTETLPHTDQSQVSNNISIVDLTSCSQVQKANTPFWLPSSSKAINLQNSIPAKSKSKPTRKAKKRKQQEESNQGHIGDYFTKVPNTSCTEGSAPFFHGNTPYGTEVNAVTNPHMVSVSANFINNASIDQEKGPSVAHQEKGITKGHKDQKLLSPAVHSSSVSYQFKKETIITDASTSQTAIFNSYAVCENFTNPKTTTHSISILPILTSHTTQNTGQRPGKTEYSCTSSNLHPGRVSNDLHPPGSINIVLDPSVAADYLTQLRSVLPIRAGEVITGDRDEFKDFWSESFAEVRMTESFWRTVDAW